MTTVTVGHPANLDDLEHADDTELVDTYWKLVAIEHANAIAGTITHEPLARRRWIEWCIGQRLNDPDSFLHRQLTPGVRAHCWALAALDGDVLHDHLRRTTTVAHLTRRHLHAHIDRASR